MRWWFDRCDGPRCHCSGRGRDFPHAKLGCYHDNAPHQQSYDCGTEPRASATSASTINCIKFTTTSLTGNWATMGPFSGPPTPMLPPDHPHPGRVLGEIRNHRRAPSSPTRPRDALSEKPRELNKKALSSMNLRGLSRDKIERKEDDKLSKDKPRSPDEESPKKPKKSKSSTSISSMLGKSRSPKKSGETSRRPKDKENTTPPSALAVNRTPIWEQMHTSKLTDVAEKDNERSVLADEIAKYTPRDYSPSKQRNFYGGYQPTLGKRTPSSTRPQSTIVTASIWSDNISTRRTSRDEEQTAVDKRYSACMPPPASRDASQITLAQPASSIRRASPERNGGGEQPKQGLGITKRGARVMAAVAAFNGRTKESETEPPLDPKAIDAAFEEMLVSMLRNVKVK